MPARLHKDARIKLLRPLFARDGFLCLICLLPLRFPFETGIPEADESPRWATIDHVNNTPSKHTLAELACLCQSCNTTERNYRQAGRKRVLRLDTLETMASLARRRCLVIAPGIRFYSPEEILAGTPGGLVRTLSDLPPLPRWENAAETTVSSNAGAGESEVAFHHMPPEREREGERENVDAGGEEKAPAQEPLKLMPRGRKIARTFIGREELDAASAQAEVLEELMAPLFRLWLCVAVYRREGKGLTRKEALTAGGEYLLRHLGRGAKQTVTRYFDSATNTLNGWLREEDDGRGRSVYLFAATLQLQEWFETLYGYVVTLSAAVTGPTPWLEELTLVEGAIP